MPTDRELMQQALDALENVWVFVNSREKIKQPEGGDWYREVVEALRARLAQPEKTNQCGEVCERAKLCAICTRGLEQAEQEPVAWSERELELIDGMIEVQVIHAERCDSMPNRAMAEKQKGWDMERIELLRKIRNTTPPQREWQGLTDEEVLTVMQSAKDFQGRIAMTWVNHENQTYVTDVGNRIARAIEQTLREKNT